MLSRGARTIMRAVVADVHRVAAVEVTFNHKMLEAQLQKPRPVAPRVRVAALDDRIDVLKLPIT